MWSVKPYLTGSIGTFELTMNEYMTFHTTVGCGKYGRYFNSLSLSDETGSDALYYFPSDEDSW